MLRLKPIIIQSDVVVVTASKREQSFREVPVSVSTVTAQAILERNVISIDDALRYVPGVNLMQDQVNIRGSTGYSRGVGSRVLILLDGLPYLTGDTGEISWETIPAHQVEKIEVVKGAGSALYGSSALGGVINVLTKGSTPEPQLRFRLFSGMYDQPRYAEWKWSPKSRFSSGALFDVGSTAGALQYIVSGSHSLDESYRQNDLYRRWSMYSKLKYDLTAYRSVTVVGNLLLRKHGNFLWWKNLREALRPEDSQLNDDVTSRRGNVSLSYKEFVRDDFFFTVKGIYFGNFWKADSAGKVYSQSASDLFSLDVQGTHQLSQHNVLTFGLAGNYDKVRSTIFGNHPGLGGAVYVQDEHALSPVLNVVVGARYDVQRVSALPSEGRLTPKLGMTYQAGEGTTLRTSYGAGFRYPSIGELYTSLSGGAGSIVVLPNPNLRAEKSWTLEAGIAQSISDHVFVDAALFTNEFRDLIEAGVSIRRVMRDPADTVGVERPVIQFDNVTKARIQGGELGIKVDWWKNVLLSELGYTYAWPRDLADQSILKFRPRHLFYASTAATIGDARISGDYRYVSRIDRIDENLVRLAPIVHGDQRVAIHVVDVRAWYDLSVVGFPLRAGLNVKNLLNYHYVELIGNLAPLRTFVLSLEGAL
jgi:outer membrane receptor for ferrienterochelin and colicins